jgi:hypothetical protein
LDEDIAAGDDGGGDATSGAAVGGDGDDSGVAAAGAAAAAAPEPPAAASACEYDSWTSIQLLTKAEELLVRALTVDAAHAQANVVCGCVYERFAELEREANAAAHAARASSAEHDDDAAGDGGDDGAGACADPNTQPAASGWTPEQRLQRAESFYEYVTAAYPGTDDFAQAAFQLAGMLKRAGKLQEAKEQIEAAMAHAPALAGAADLKTRITRLLAGKPEVEPEAPRVDRRRRGEDEIKLLDVGVALPLGAMSPGMTAEDRDAAFWNTLRADKVRKEEEARRQEEARVASMTPEEREEYERTKADKEKHEQRKARMLDGQMRGYSATGASALKARGRGRARGGGGGGGGRGR